MTPSLIEASRRAFMASNGIDLQTPAREKRAAVRAYNPDYRRALPGAYHRFDYKTPGAALADAGASGNPYWEDPVQTAANYYDTVMGTDFGRARRDLRAFTTNPANNPLLNANRERDPRIAERWMATTVPLERNQPGGSNWKARQWFEENAPNASTAQDKAMAWDGLARFRQWQNQRPPRGILSSPIFAIATTALGSAFGMPLLQSALLKAAGLARIAPAINAIQTIKTGFDIGRGFANPRGSSSGRSPRP